GDVNGDGFKDIIVGAPQMRVNPGRAYIFLGGVKFDTIPDVTLIGKPASPAGFSRFGIKVASAGDVNSDGY
ncbi:MAG: VCBS repeat-containing protein, partial [candidate division Zixibacteria bacterium]|nr:VCBS repeat-containing protein [candidate division Zixibacteria bacterium]